MNKYPVWKYLTILAIVVGATIYALPNLHAPDPAIQISSETSGATISPNLVERAAAELEQAGIGVKEYELDDRGTSALIRLLDSEQQLPAKDLVDGSLGDGYVVALNLAPTTPEWLQGIGAQPMKLGLDLSGGVHFLLEVDIDAAVAARADGLAATMRNLLIEEGIRFRTPDLTDDHQVLVGFRSEEDRAVARSLITEATINLVLENYEDTGLYSLRMGYNETEKNNIEERALQQNLTSLKNRVNELGVAEPLVQRQGPNRIVVELPGIQDTAEAKRIIGKTANLEFRMEYDPRETSIYEEFPFRDATVGMGTARLDRDPIVTGESVVDASTGFDENGRPQVNITLSSEGGAQMHRATRDDIGSRMAVLFIEFKGRTVEEEGPDGEIISSVESYA